MSEQEAVHVLSYKLERNTETGQATATVVFMCPNCKLFHELREVYSSIPANFSVPGRQLPCGYVHVVMPWAERK